MRSSDLSVKACINVLAGFLGLAGTGKAGLEGAFSGARFMRFSFETPIVSRVDPSALGMWLRGKPPVEQCLVDRYIMDADRESACAYVITETLSAKEFAIESAIESAASPHAEVPGGRGLLDVEGGFTARQETKGRIVYSGKKYLTFGFKAFRLVYSGNAFGLKDVRLPIKYLGPAMAEDRPVIFGEELVDLSMGT